MPKLFGVDIAGIIAREMGPKLLPLTLTRTALGVRIPAALTSGPTRATTSFSGRGVVTEYAHVQDGETVKRGAKTILILGASIGVVPAPDDVVVIEGITATITKVDRDPAGASYVCQCRG